MKAVLKNIRKMFILQAPFDSEYSEFYEKYYFKGLDSSKLFGSLAKGEFSGKTLYLSV